MNIITKMYEWIWSIWHPYWQDIYIYFFPRYIYLEMQYTQGMDAQTYPKQSRPPSMAAEDRRWWPETPNPDGREASWSTVSALVTGGKNSHQSGSVTGLGKKQEETWTLLINSDWNILNRRFGNISIFTLCNLCSMRAYGRVNI